MKLTKLWLFLYKTLEYKQSHHSSPQTQFEHPLRRRPGI